MRGIRRGRPALLTAALLTACHGGGSPPDRPTRPESEAPAAPVPKPPACPAGWGRCAGAAACTTDLDSSRAHCGACAAACDAHEACVGGKCSAGTVEVAVGGSHSCLRQADGGVRCWGLNGLGQLGVAGPAAQTHPTPVAVLAGSTRALALGRDYSCALGDDARVRCFGEPGALGRSGVNGGPKPAPVEGLESVVALDASVRHACAVEASGGVWCWGSNVAMQLGFETPEEEEPFSATPVRIAGVPEAIDVATGYAHVCAVTRTRELWCWGDNSFGQLGDGTTESRPTAAMVAGLEDVAAVSLGAFHGCARTRAGELLCWGRNEAGQLGVGDTRDRPRPTPVGLEAVRHVSAGERHVCAVAGERVHCWGEGEGGRLGDGGEADRDLPFELTAIGGAVRVAAGERHSCALSAGDTIHCWGVNDGQLGDGTTTLRSVPTAVQMTGASGE